MINYVADHREALAEVEKHGISIADKVAGWLLLRRAGLSTEQKQIVCISFHPGLRYGSPLLPVRPRLQRTC
jgi:hypothetical protein